MNEPAAEERPPGRAAWGPRLLAPLALVLGLIVLAVVINGSLGIDDEPSATQSTDRTTQAGDGEGDGAETPKTYLVEEGDTLSTIAEQFDVSQERLVRLNPDVDPQTLNVGTELKIR